MRSNPIKDSGKYCIPLKSQYPFHTELLHNAGLKLAGFLSSIDMKEMKIPVVFNYTGRPKTEDEQIGKIIELYAMELICALPEKLTLIF